MKNRSKEESRRPKYQSVGLALLRDWEESGRPASSTQKELAEQYGVHVLTLRHALQWLEQTGKLARLANRKHAVAGGALSAKPLIGFPLWVDSFIDLDVFRIDGRLRLARSIAWELAAHGYQLDVQLVGPESNPNRAKIETLLSQWSGVILEPFSGESDISPDNPFLPMLDRAALIGVLQNRQQNCVFPDFYAAGQLAVGEFTRLQCQRILYTGRRDERSAHQFLRIVSAETAADRHRKVDIVYAEGGFHAEEAFSAVKRFYIEGGQCDAIFAGSGYAALGALRAMSDLGIRCPEDVQLIATGRNSFTAFLTPKVTTIAAEEGRLGKEVARMAIALARPGATPRSNIIVPVQLIHGETTRSSTQLPATPAPTTESTLHPRAEAHQRKAESRSGRPKSDILGQSGF